MSCSAKIAVQNQSKADSAGHPDQTVKFSGISPVIFYGGRGSYRGSYAGLRALRDGNYRRRYKCQQPRNYREYAGPHSLPGSRSSWFVHNHREHPDRRPYTRRLIRAVVWMDVLADAHGLGCAAGDFSKCKGDKTICDKQGGRYLGKHWDGCPVRAIMDDRRLAASLLLERESTISPLAGWPSNYASWVSTYLTTLKQLRDDREAHAMKQISGKGKKWQRNA